VNDGVHDHVRPHCIHNVGDLQEDQQNLEMSVGNRISNRFPIVRHFRLKTPKNEQNQDNQQQQSNGNDKSNQMAIAAALKAVISAVEIQIVFWFKDAFGAKATSSTEKRGKKIENCYL
jgi:hypothetical protein